MVSSHRLRFVPRWLVSMLVVLLVLGYSCDTPAFAELTSHAGDGAHHPADDKADESLVSCGGAVGLPSSAGHLQPGPSLDATEVLPVGDGFHLRLIHAPPKTLQGLASRPPLFVLYASLLI